VSDPPCYDEYMVKHSAGILLYRKVEVEYEVLLVHPGGPFWANKDLGAWSIPKGEFELDEEPLAAAMREFEEEVGTPPPSGDYVSFGEFRRLSGKIIHAFTLEADFSLEQFHSNTFTMEWPPKSGVQQEFPENDRAAWMPLSVAVDKIVKGQVPIIEMLATKLRITIARPE